MAQFKLKVGTLSNTTKITTTTTTITTATASGRVIKSKREGQTV